MQDTYRYHGHSISDPGSSYRTRDEVQGVRRARDPIEHVRKLIVDHDIAQSDELKKLERSIKKEVGINIPLQLCLQTFLRYIQSTIFNFMPVKGDAVLFVPEASQNASLPNTSPL